MPECNNYTSLFHPWRRVNQNISKPSSICDRNFTSNSTWYRFGKAKILEHGCPNTTSQSCGVKYPGYLNQTHPSVEDGVKKMRIHYYRYNCSGDIGTVFVRNCAGFYVYKFPYLPEKDCEYGICTEYMRNNTEKEWLNRMHRIGLTFYFISFSFFVFLLFIFEVTILWDGFKLNKLYDKKI